MFQDTSTALVHGGPAATPFRSLLAPALAFGLFPLRGGAGRVFPVQLRIATVNAPSSHLIVCVLAEMVCK